MQCGVMFVCDDVGVMFVCDDVGMIKAMAVADSWVSVGNSTGSINTLDIKTGEVLSLWKPMDQVSDHQVTVDYEAPFKIKCHQVSEIYIGHPIYILDVQYIYRTSNIYISDV